VPLLSVAVAAAAEYSPAFYWSPKAFGGLAGATEHLREAAAADLEGTLVGKGGSLLAAARAAEAQPEVRLVFLAEGLRTEVLRAHGAALPALDRLLQSSASSLTAPFTLAHEASLFEHHVAAARVPAAEAEAYLKAHPELFSNGVPDLLLVQLPPASATVPARDLAAIDGLVGRVSRAVDAATHGRYVALLTSAAAPPGLRKLAATTYPKSYLYIGPTLLTAYMVGLLLFVIFISGFCCLFSLQTPKRFEEAKAA